jgi:peptidoglycan-associated lipoprotein
MRPNGLTALIPLCALSPLIGCARTPPPPPVAKPEPVVAKATVPAARSMVPLPQLPASPISAADVRRGSIYFPFDSYVLGPEAGPLLQSIAATAKRGGHGMRIEGHCDERGTPEYNMALGEGRARSVQRYLEYLGIPKDKTTVVSFGSQRPKAPGHDEASWAQNRRGDVVIQ